MGNSSFLVLVVLIWISTIIFSRKHISPYWHKLIIFNPLYTNGFFLLVWDNKLGITHCTYQGVSGYKLKKILYSFFYRLLLPLQTVHTLMECSNMLHFIWVFNVCICTRLGVSLVQKGYVHIVNKWAATWENQLRGPIYKSVIQL